MKISGGSYGRRFEARPGSDVELIGGEFELNGVTYTDSTITLTEGDVFTGTLADGSPFVFSPLVGDIGFVAGDDLIGVTLTTAALPPLDTTPLVVSTDILATVPFGLREGQDVMLQPGGVLGAALAVVDARLNVEGGEVHRGLDVARSVVNISGGSVASSFVANLGSEVNISGGSVSGNFYALTGSQVNLSGGSIGVSSAVSGSVVNISDGTIGNRFEASAGSEVNISGGTVGDRFEVNSGSVVNMSGGVVGEDFAVGDGSVLNISSGTVGEDFSASRGSEVNISGGEFGDLFRARPGSEVNLFGTEFYLNGNLLDMLIEDKPFLVVDRGGQTLSGTLINGSEFSFELNESFDFRADFFSLESLLRVKLVTPGNFDLDADVDGSDYLLLQRNPDIGNFADWATNYGSIVTPDPPGNFDLDTDVDGSDFLAWQENTGLGNLADWQANYGSSTDGASLEATSLPEPSAAMLLLAMVLTFVRISRRQ